MLRSRRPTHLAAPDRRESLLLHALALVMAVALAVTAVAAASNPDPSAGADPAPRPIKVVTDEAITTTTTSTTAPPTTTTTAPPPTTTTTAPPSPPPVRTVAQPGGECGGWLDVVQLYFPADAVAKACQVLVCESGGNPFAYNPSGASGLFQFMPGTWESTTGTPAPASAYPPDHQIAAAGVLYGRSGWAPWSCA